MIFEQFYLSCLAQASYLIGSDGLAAIVDPQRDVDLYIQAANERGLQIRYIIETHLHADFVSGHRELAERTGARIYIGRAAGATFSHVPVTEAEEIRFGNCRLRFLETPGHTPESICVVVYDFDRRQEPWAVLTGDTLFIGDVGRPDLSKEHTPQQLAGLLFDSLHNKVLKLPDDVLVYPAHGAGSMCGRAISSDRSSTIGQERRFNYALQPMSRDEFVRLTTEDLPARPEYFARDVDLNRRGAMTLGELPRLEPLSVQAVKRLLGDGAILLDVRPNPSFCAGHVPHSINIALQGQFASWAGALLGLDRNLVIISDDDGQSDEARQRLARVGIERVAGYLDGGTTGWVSSGGVLESTSQVSVHELSEMASEDTLCIVDVRRPSEWKTGHVPGAIHAALDDFGRQLPALRTADAVAVYCKSGYRSTIACSFLQSAGIGNLLNVLGGFDAWAAANLPIAAA